MNSTHTLVISDIHIGSAISSSHDVLNLLESTTYKRLILLGDIFDGPHVRKLTANDEKFLSYIEKLITEGVEVIWVRGNHDRIENKIMQRFENVSFVDEYCWNVGEKRYCAMHGHQFDTKSPKQVHMGKISTRFHSLFAIIIRHKKTVKALEHLYTTMRKLSKKIADGAIAYADQNGVDYIICAHTHRSMKKTQMSKNNKPIHYFNTGSWIHVPYSYVTVDEKGIDVKLYESAKKD